jgi:hypothetical protein
LKSHTKIKEYHGELFQLYESDEAYLYLINEATSLPIVRNKPIPYPLELSEPVSIVKKLLPFNVGGYNTYAVKMR